MSSPELDNLVSIGRLKQEDPTDDELTGLLSSGNARLVDAERGELSFDSRFDLAYNAAHAFALCALRRAGYRCDHRYTVFQAIPHTVGLPTAHWRVLAKAHERRNMAEYEGYLERDEQLLRETIAAAKIVRDALGTPS